MRKRLLLMVLLSAILGASGRLWARSAQPACANTGCWVCWSGSEWQACCIYASGLSCSLSSPYSCTNSSCRPF